MTMTPSRVSRSTLLVLVLASLWALVGVAIVHRTRDATKDLRESESLSFFNFGGFTRGALDFQWLLRVPGTERRFMQLVEKGSPSAKLFGACGLYLAGSDSFETVRDGLSRDDAEVVVGLGCIHIKQQIRELAPDLPRTCPQMRLSILQWAMGEVGWLTRFW